MYVWRDRILQLQNIHKPCIAIPESCHALNQMDMLIYVYTCMERECIASPESCYELNSGKYYVYIYIYIHTHTHTSVWRNRISRTWETAKSCIATLIFIMIVFFLSIKKTYIDTEGWEQRPNRYGSGIWTWVFLSIKKKTVIMKMTVILSLALHWIR